MYLQTQRLIGQQSLAEFMGLHLDLEQIYCDNRIREGPNITRKGGLIVNAGDNPTQREVFEKRELNKAKYGLSTTVVTGLQLPKTQTKEWLKVLTLEQILRNSSNFSVTEKIVHLNVLKEALERKLQKVVIGELKKVHDKDYRDCNIIIVVKVDIGGGGLGSEIFEFEKAIEVKPKEKQNPNRMLDENLKSLQAERLERARRQAKSNSHQQEELEDKPFEEDFD